MQDSGRGESSRCAFTPVRAIAPISCTPLRCTLLPPSAVKANARPGCRLATRWRKNRNEANEAENAKQSVAASVSGERRACATRHSAGSTIRSVSCYRGSRISRGTDRDAKVVAHRVSVHVRSRHLATSRQNIRICRGARSESAAKPNNDVWPPTHSTSISLTRRHL